MRFRAAVSTLILLAAATAVQATEFSQQQLGSIRTLGQLNGVALNCKFLIETQRMKKALVVALPKRRQLGELFDTETNDAFLAFIQKGETCPKEAAFSNQVDEAILALDEAFPR